MPCFWAGSFHEPSVPIRFSQSRNLLSAGTSLSSAGCLLGSYLKRPTTNLHCRIQTLSTAGQTERGPQVESRGKTSLNLQHVFYYVPFKLCAAIWGCHPSQNGAGLRCQCHDHSWLTTQVRAFKVSCLGAQVLPIYLVTN